MKKKKKPETKKHIKHKDYENLNISGLEDHSRQGGILSPPLTKIGPQSYVSWRDQGLNEVLWAAILRGNMEQSECLDIFRRIVVNARENISERKITFITHSALAVSTNDLFDQILSPLLNNERAKHLLSSLLYFECIPDRNHWKRHLKEPDPESHVKFVMKGISSCMDHQSQEATDIRWFKLIYCMIVQERILMPGLTSERIEEFRLYPYYGDQRMVRPSIRAMEISLRTDIEERGVPFEIPEEIVKKVSTSWSAEFWKECLNKTPCYTGELKQPVHNDNTIYIRQILNIYKALSEHYIESIESTDIDAKYDSCFGIALYSLVLALELATSNVALDNRTLGRIVLRTIVENFVTLKYLEYKDDPTLWMQFRNYGTGQSKLAFLKNLREESIPDFINLRDLQVYSNEDLWQEFSNINIKPWSDKNLRKMAEEAGIKDYYDKYYDWSSSYVHGSWAAIRDTVFTVCLNPLHRYHRIPFIPKLDMPSVLPDIAKIVNTMLDVINRLYPSFKPRIKHTTKSTTKRTKKQKKT